MFIILIFMNEPLNVNVLERFLMMMKYKYALEVRVRCMNHLKVTNY